MSTPEMTDDGKTIEIKVGHLTIKNVGDRIDASCSKCSQGIDIPPMFGPIPQDIFLATWIKQHAHAPKAMSAGLCPYCPAAAGSDVVNRLRQQADDIDPGLSAARFSLSPKARAKQEAIARHWKAAGIRTALIELALTDPSGAGE